MSVDHPCFLLQHSTVLRSAKRVWVVVLMAGCQTSAIVGTYADGGGRCDPLGPLCAPDSACTVRSDPNLDGCRAPGTIATGAACSELDACVPGSQCAFDGGDAVSLLPEMVALGGTCRAICARDLVSCGPLRCVGIESGAGVRVDFGVCAP